MSPVEMLCRWYESHCNDDWEHQYGIEIGTIDNPGWRVQIGLKGTELEGRKMVFKEIDRSDRDWIHCWVEENRFNGRGGPQNLIEIIECFFVWADDVSAN